MFYQLYETPEYHLNLRLLPRFSINAGFELNTGTYINTVSPERAPLTSGENTCLENEPCRETDSIRGTREKNYILSIRNKKKSQIYLSRIKQKLSY